MKKVIVFGGAGFLGSHVADELTKRGHKVTIYDKRISKYLQKKQKQIVGEILDEKKALKAIEKQDVVYNFAGIADIDQAKYIPVETIRTNVIGNTYILNACVKHKIKRYVFASSVYVYSDKGSFYKVSKQSNELIIQEFNKVYNLDYTILRYGSLYGERADETNWIYHILKQALLENRITRKGDGQEIREYINVKDAAKLSVDILDKQYKNQNLIITGGQTMKVQDILLMIQEIMKNRIKIIYKKNSKYEEHYEITPYVFQPAEGKKLMANPHYDLGQGILELLYKIKQDIDKK